MPVAIIKTSEIGRLKNIVNLPFDIIRDRRKAGSIIPPKIMPKTTGAISYLKLFHQISDDAE